LVSQAVAELHLGRYDEAEAALNQALEKEPGNADVIANLIVLSILSGKEPESYVR
jgi:coatomer protein complex subunit epsilon